MAGMFDKQAHLYLDGRPDYPSQWYSMLASHTLHHSLAWGVGTGNGQAALGVTRHFKKVIATDENEPSSPLDPNNFSLELSSSVVLCDFSLKTPIVIAVWCYNDIVVSPEFDPVMKRFHDLALPFYNPKIQHLFDGYAKFPFPFEDVGLGCCEGKPLELEMPKELSFEGVLKMVGSWSAVVTAKEQGVELLPENVVTEFENAWGGPKLVRSDVYKAFMLAGQVKL